MTDGGGGATEQLVEAGRDALARGAWEEARESFQAALRDRETPEALEGLSWAAWWLNDPEVVFATRKRPSGGTARKASNAGPRVWRCGFRPIISSSGARPRSPTGGGSGPGGS